MNVHCMVFVDGSMTSESFNFASVPRVGDSVQIAPFSDPQVLTVTSVMHVAEGACDESPKAHVQLNVSSKKASNASRGFGTS